MAKSTNSMAMFTSFLMLLVGLPEANSGENPKQHIQRQLIKGWIPAGAALEDSAQGVHGVFFRPPYRPGAQSHAGVTHVNNPKWVKFENCNLGYHYLSIYLSIYPAIYLSIYLSI